MRSQTEEDRRARYARRIVTGAEDGVAKVWRFDHLEEPASTSIKKDDDKVPICEVTLSSGPGWEGHTAGITSVSYSPKGVGDLVLTSSKDKTLKIWRPSNPETPLYITCPEKRPEKDKTKDLENEDDPHISAHPAKALAGHQDYVNMASWCSAGTYRGRVVLSCSDDRNAILWNPNDGRKIGTLDGHTDAISTAIYSKDGTRILTASHDTTCMLWDPNRQEDQMHLRTFDGKRSPYRHSMEIWSARFSSDEGNNRIVTASKDTNCIIWSTSTGQAERILGTESEKLEERKKVGHEDCVLDAVFNETNSQQVLTCSLDGTARLWDLRKPDACNVYKDHTSTVWSAKYGNDPYLIITAGHDMLAMVYDTRMSRPKQTLAGHRGVLWQATFSPDDLWAVTCSEDGTARLWDLSTGYEFPRGHELKDKSSRSAAPVTCADFHRRAFD